MRDQFVKLVWDNKVIIFSLQIPILRIYKLRNLAERNSAFLYKCNVITRKVKPALILVLETGE